MKKISRNAPCPCGSGKKYKRCCMRKNEAERPRSINSLHIEQNIEKNVADRDVYPNLVLVEDELDLLSNSVIYLIQEGQLDKAEEKCRELLDNYPDVVDGLDRFAMLYEARGEKQLAVEYYQKSADFMESRPGYDRELIRLALNKVKELSE